jgi:HNH endonuclease/NUMOD4 motif
MSVDHVIPRKASTEPAPHIAALAVAREWRPCQWPGYEVSEDGRVRQAKRQRLLKRQRHKDGYVRYCTRIKGAWVQVYAHQAVAYAWLGPCPPGMEVDHKDEDRQNNHVGNLAYVTHRANCRRRRWPRRFAVGQRPPMFLGST